MTAPNQSPPIHPSPELGVGEGQREAILRQLLPVDYEYAHDSGLIDLFDYDPTRGEDGLIHVLAGNFATGPDGSLIPHGYHHEGSGMAVWGSVQTEEGDSRSVTRVDREHLETANSSTRRQFAERLAEPYLAQVAIGDRPKFSAHRNRDTGEVRLARARNSMYPKEYDALAVMQAVRIAYQGRDAGLDRPSVNDLGEDVLVNDSQVPLIDGKSVMTVRLIMNPENMKVKTAFPLVSSKGVMNLTEDQLLGHITYGMAGDRPPEL